MDPELLAAIRKVNPSYKRKRENPARCEVCGCAVRVGHVEQRWCSVACHARSPAGLTERYAHAAAKAAATIAKNRKSRRAVLRAMLQERLRGR